MHGFLSRDGMAPRELLAVGRSELQTYGVELTQDDVVDISWRGIEPGFVVELSGGTTLETRTVLVATGLRDSLPEIPGIQELWGGQSVLHCPYCHAYEISDQPIGVLGGDAREMSLHQAFLLGQWSSDVTFFPRQDLAHPPRRTRATGCPRSDGCRRIGIWIGLREKQTESRRTRQRPTCCALSTVRCAAFRSERRTSDATRLQNQPPRDSWLSIVPAPPVFLVSGGAPATSSTLAPR